MENNMDNNEEKHNNYAFDFAVRLDDLISGMLRGGVTPNALQEVLRNVTHDLDDPEKIKEFL
jgi:hypothetical protein